MAEDKKDFFYLFQHSPQAQLVIDAGGEIMFANERAATRCGAQQGQSLTEVLYPHQWQELTLWLSDLTSREYLDVCLSQPNADSAAQIAKITCANEWYRITVSKIQTLSVVSSQQVPYLLVFQNITELYELQQRNEQIANVFENSSEGIMITDRQHRIIDVNPAFSQITGYERNEVLGQTPDFLESVMHQPGFYQELWVQIEEFGFWQGEVWNRKKNGESFVEWQTTNAVKNKQGKISHYVSFFNDITKLKRNEQELFDLAHHDPLTGLPNRLMLMGMIDKSIARANRKRHNVGLLFLDLDRFKIINDTMGHHVGDELLIEISRRLIEAVRRSDSVIRLGGDEFTILLDELMRPEDAAFVAQKVIEAIRKPVVLQGREIIITTSIGISVFPNDANDGDELLKAADSAMYRAKDMGRNVYQFYTSDLTDNVQEQLELEFMLREALEKQQLTLYYQPQINITTGEVVGAEALLRWIHPERGIIPPGKFLPLAEETGLINDIGYWVVQTAIKQIRVWLDEGLPPIRIAVNLSARQLLTDDITWQVEKLLNDYDVAPELLELEILEDTLHNTDDCVVTFHALKAIGLNLAIDDFGSGYSSLSRLKTFPIDQLKVDRAFVKNIAFDQDDQSICRAILALGESLGLQVVAEGVEEAEQLEFLRQQGCEVVQGFYFAKPMPVAEFPGFIRNFSLPTQ